MWKESPTGPPACKRESQRHVALAFLSVPNPLFMKVTRLVMASIYDVDMVFGTCAGSRRMRDPLRAQLENMYSLHMVSFIDL